MIPTRIRPLQATGNPGYPADSKGFFARPKERCYLIARDAGTNPRRRYPAGRGIQTLVPAPGTRRRLNDKYPYC